MKSRLEIKGKVLGQGTPLICVPVMEATKEGIVEEVRRLAKAGASVIEWRVDAFEGVGSLNAVRDVLADIREDVTETILLFTFRSKEQGGLCSLDYEKIYDLHQVAAESQIVDLIDVEYFQSDDIDKEIHCLHRMGAKVVSSHHDFYETPSSDVIYMILEQMKHSHADIVKLAVMPQSSEDVLRLLEQTNAFHKKYPNQPLVTMSMGPMGMVSRITGELFGSCITFGAGKMKSAPGQLPMEELADVLDKMKLG